MRKITMAPQVGMLVDYYCSENSRWPALITAVHSGTCVNLAVFSETYGYVTSICQRDAKTVLRVWDWQGAVQEKGSF